MNLLQIFTVLLLFLILKCVRTEIWPHHEVLDTEGKFHLYWKPPEDKKPESEIIFKLEVKTNGYVGFGLSPDGNLPGSDIVTGWVKEGHAFFQDRHADGRNLPVLDEKQDWILMHAGENFTHTILQFRRKLDTCDEDDIVIDDNTMRVIYAFSDVDPRGRHLRYRYENWGSKSLLLLRYKFPVPNNQHLLHWDIGANNLDISPYETIYLCKVFKSPQLSKKHHIIHIQPMIQKGHEQFVHHMVLFECVDGKPEDYEELLESDGYDCYGDYLTMPEAIRKCRGSMVGWSVGGEGITFPDVAGIPLDATPGKYYLLEIHYDNRQRMQGIFDNSGLRFSYTPHLRKYDASGLFIGSSLTPRMFIPPSQPSYVVVGHSNPECLRDVMPEEGINLFGIYLHSHIRAEKMSARHFRGSKELPPISVDNKYDFHYQEFKFFKDGISFLPGDQVAVECTFNTTTRYTATFGGRSSLEEMCIANILYYPLIERRFTMLSAPTLSTINKILDTDFKVDSDVYSLFNYNWSNVDVSEVEYHMRHSEHNSECWIGNGDTKPMSMISYPSDLEPYVPPDSTCNEDNHDLEYETEYKDDIPEFRHEDSHEKWIPEK